MSQFRVRITEPFPVSFPGPVGSAIFNSAPGNCEAVADGIYLIYRTSGKKTGKPGQHRIHFKGNIGISDDKDSIDPIGYTEDVTYTLNEKDTL